MKPELPPSLKLKASSYLKNSVGIQRTGIMKKAFILVTTSSADQNNINHLYNGIIDFEERWNFS
jgi:ABC-type tungstate transport system permease subunit